MILICYCAFCKLFPGKFYIIFCVLDQTRKFVTQHWYKWVFYNVYGWWLLHISKTKFAVLVAFSQTYSLFICIIVTVLYYNCTENRISLILRYFSWNKYKNLKLIVTWAVYCYTRSMCTGHTSSNNRTVLYALRRDTD